MGTSQAHGPDSVLAALQRGEPVSLSGTRVLSGSVRDPESKMVSLHIWWVGPGSVTLTASGLTLIHGLCSCLSFPIQHSICFLSLA